MDGKAEALFHDSTVAGVNLAEGLQKALNESIAKHTGQPLERVEKDSDRDYFMGAQEARAYGIVDEVVSVNRKSLKSAEERRDR
jgi:ATP-dependent Clp protease protease subunit